MIRALVNPATSTPTLLLTVRNSTPRQTPRVATSRLLSGSVGRMYSKVYTCESHSSILQARNASTTTGRALRDARESTVTGRTK